MEELLERSKGREKRNGLLGFGGNMGSRDESSGTVKAEVAHMDKKIRTGLAN